ncbi:MAG: hypothetical protein COZ06_27975 [Armatimonadetes bacterium CG_4_10_14_3_um_filter_66_18]|nr:MAG: hypothetical protein COS65_15945 [Armatimonadetes bacterium CG06_land_8_20_14_3_00_66_21]PIY40595.1 MAG: hypothetical protein COZ06_27975 [Armatimonadetes bacterium CG_4_10_14_3_um_filter_66_18]
MPDRHGEVPVVQRPGRARAQTPILCRGTLTANQRLQEARAVKCKTARGLVSEYVSRILSAEQKQSVEAHLRECSACEKLHADMRQAVRALQLLPTDQPAAGFWNRLSARLPASPKRRWAWVPLQSPRLRLQVALPALVAAATAMAVMFPKTPERSVRHVQSSKQALYVLQCVEQHATYGGDRLLGQEAIPVESGNGASSF